MCAAPLTCICPDLHPGRLPCGLQLPRHAAIAPCRLLLIAGSWSQESSWMSDSTPSTLNPARMAGGGSKVEHL